MNITLRIMRYFVAAAHLQSLSKAAEKLNISQSAVSNAVDTLELELGLKLFHRKRSQGITLTSNGRNSLAKIQSILDQVDNFKTDILDFHNEISGDLHVGCFTAIAPIILAPILKNMTQDHAAINVSISEGNVRHIFDSVHRGEVDVGISYDEADISAGLITKTLAVVPPHVILPDNHPLTMKKEISLKNLADQPLILLDMPNSRQYYTSLFETAGFHPNFVYRSSNYEMVRSLVGAGLGLALLQTRPPAEMTHCGSPVVCKPLTGKVRKSRLVIAYTEYAIRRKAVEAFVQYAEEYFTSPQARRIIVSP